MVQWFFASLVNYNWQKNVLWGKKSFMDFFVYINIIYESYKGPILQHYYVVSHAYYFFDILLVIFFYHYILCKKCKNISLTLDVNHALWSQIKTLTSAKYNFFKHNFFWGNTHLRLPLRLFLSPSSQNCHWSDIKYAIPISTRDETDIWWLLYLTKQKC